MNGGPPTGEAFDATHLLDDRDALVARLESDGYLLLRRLIDPGLLGTIARSWQQEIRAREPADPGDARESGPPGRPGRPQPLDAKRAAEDRALYRALFCEPLVHELGHDHALVALMSGLLGTSELLVHPRPGCRTVPPDASAAPKEATPAHQDHTGMQGTPATLTAWIPLVACPRSAGGLAVASSSHRQGRRAARLVPGTRVLACEEEPGNDRFVTSDYQPGDVLVFHSLTVHKAPANRSAVTRLSVDHRYQRVSDPVCEATLADVGDLSWEDVYAGWEPGTGRRYYWRTQPLTVVAYDRAYLTEALGSRLT